MKKIIKTLSLSSILALGLLVGCGDDDNNSRSAAAPASEEQPADSEAPQAEEEAPAAEVVQTPGPLGANALQVERLARPAINEGLIISNAFLNAFNSIPPSADLSDAAAPVRAEAATVIEAADMIDGKDDVPLEVVVGAFLPDVMRIDTTLDIAPGTPAYNAAASGPRGMLVGGRKIEDDVMDITLSFLVAGDLTGKKVQDGVSYKGVRGNPAQSGHKMLHGQTKRGGPATFPFLAIPN